MSETVSVKERIAAKFEKVKSEERMRADRVQAIVREAFSQAIAEVKEGSGEIQSIAQDTFSNTLEELKEKAKEVKEGFAQPFDAGAEEEKLKEQFTWLGRKLAELDNKVSGPFNDRLAKLRLRLTEMAKGWYGSLNEETQTELEGKYVEAKRNLTDRQQQFRQRLKDLLQSTASKL
jgi:hypothetical protein